jgi:hypothetical protein
MTKTPARGWASRSAIERDLSSRQTQYVVKDMEIGQPSSAPGTASTTGQARLPNPIMCSSWSALQKPTAHEYRKTDLRIPAAKNLPK